MHGQFLRVLWHSLLDQRSAGVAIDSDELVYVADDDCHSISVFTSDDYLLRSLGSRGKGSGQFNRPHEIAVDKDGLVYVSELGNNRL